MGLLLLCAASAFVGWWLWERRHRRTGAVAGGLHPEITLAHTQEWELWHNSFSLCSKKLRVCLAELGLEHASHPIDLIETGSYETLSRRFLAVNPAGTVPVLVHRGHPVYESHEQIVYAAEHAGAPGRELLPEDPGTRARVEHWVDCASLVGPDPTQGTHERAGHCIPGLTVPIFTTMVAHIPYWRFVEGLLFHHDRRRPVFLGALKLFGIHGLPRIAPAMALLRRSRRDMERHLDALAAELEKTGGPWIAGERFTLADVSWVVILDRLVEADWDRFFWGEGRRPVVAAYVARLTERPSYATAIVAVRDPILTEAAATLRQAKHTHANLRTALEGGDVA